MISVTVEQALAHRSRQQLLLGQGAESALAAARQIGGAQSQVLAPSLWAVAMRAASRPSAASLAAQLFDQRDWVRTWGQRGTIHLYCAATHWALWTAALELAPDGARGPNPITDAELAAAEQHIRQIARDEGRAAVRSDVMAFVSPTLRALLVERVGDEHGGERAAAGRILWTLARRGVLSCHETIGREQSYVLRDAHYPALAWDLPSPHAALPPLARRYFQAFGPATFADCAHHLGVRMRDLRPTLDALSEPATPDPLVEVDVGGRVMRVLRSHVDELQRALPRTWRPRLLPKFDTFLMGYADKSLALPDEASRPKVWGKAAQVYATVVHRGRLVATWKHRATKKKVTIDITPLPGWSPRIANALRDDAEAFAQHLGREQALVQVSGH